MKENLSKMVMHSEFASKLVYPSNFQISEDYDLQNTLELAEIQRWLRYRHGIYIGIDLGSDTHLWAFSIKPLKYSSELVPVRSRHIYDAYEDALESGIEEAFKLLPKE